jgi:peptidoglycan/xylan/chitin deacetylase (PgdA/CDA1 family)
MNFMPKMRKHELLKVRKAFRLPRSRMRALLFDLSSLLGLGILNNPTNLLVSGRVVCITFDDGYKSQLDTLPVLNQYEFKATFAIISGFADKNYSEYMTWQDIINLNNQGHDIESHTENHPRLDKLNETKLQAELINSKKSLGAHGIASEIIVYPGGHGYKSQVVRSNLLSAGYVVARTTKLGQFNLFSGDRLAVNTFEIYRYTSMNSFRRYLERTSGDLITVISYHRIGASSVSIKQFAEQMAFLFKNKYSVLTMKEVFLGLGSKKCVP